MRMRGQADCAGNIEADLAASSATSSTSSAGLLLHHKYTIVFVPHRTEPCLELLRSLGTLSHVEVQDMGLEFSVLEDDLLSLEDPSAWPRAFCDGDHTTLFRSAQALMTMQSIYGVFPRVMGKGDLANRVADLLVRQRREVLASEPENAAFSTHSSEIEALVVVDRGADPVTPLCTQLTYEGLVDEELGIRHGFVEVEATWLGAQAQGRTSAPLAGSTRRRQRLDGVHDALFTAIRDDNFAVVGEKLHRIARQLSADYEGRHAAQTVQAIRAFVHRLGDLQSQHASLRLHTCLTEHLLAATKAERFHRVLEIQQDLVAGVQPSSQLEAIVDLMYEEAPVHVVLRLVCLACVMGAGVKQKWLDGVRRDLLQTYGVKYLPVLLALERVGLLRPAARSPIADARRVLRLIDDDVDERVPRDVSYVFSGYAPLSIRLVQTMCQREALMRRVRLTMPASGEEPVAATPVLGWNGCDESVRQLPGATFDFVQEATPKAAADGAVKTVVVFFVGGITYAEIAALRLMSRQTRDRRYLIATTSTISGNSMIALLDESS